MFRVLCALYSYDNNNKIESLERIELHQNYENKTNIEKIQLMKERFKEGDLYGQIIQSSILLVLLLTIFLMNTKDIIHINTTAKAALSVEILYWAYPLTFTLLFYLIYQVIIVKDTKEYPLIKFSILIPFYYSMLFCITFSDNVYSIQEYLGITVLLTLLFIALTKWINALKVCFFKKDFLMILLIMLVSLLLIYFLIFLFKTSVQSLVVDIVHYFTIGNILVVLWSMLFMFTSIFYNLYIQMMSRGSQILSKIPLDKYEIIYDEY